jgi:hypothetical protein
MNASVKNEVKFPSHRMTFIGGKCEQRNSASAAGVLLLVCAVMAGSDLTDWTRTGNTDRRWTVGGPVYF